MSTSFFEIFYSWVRVKLKSVFGNFLKELYPRLLVTFLLITYTLDYIDFEKFILYLIYGYYLRLLIVMVYSFIINKPKVSFYFKNAIVMPVYKQVVFKGILIPIAKVLSDIQNPNSPFCANC